MMRNIENAAAVSGQNTAFMIFLTIAASVSLEVSRSDEVRNVSRTVAMGGGL